MAVGFLGRYFESGSKSASEKAKLQSNDCDEKTRPQTDAYSPPSWMQEGLVATYRTEDGATLYHEVVSQPGGLLVRWRSVESGEWAELLPEYKDSGWIETPFPKWQEESYGYPFIDASKDPTSQVLLEEETEYIGKEKLSFKGISHECLKFRSYLVQDCHCLSTARHKMFYLGPGSCPACGGVFSSLRKCPECGGTGKCTSCGGKGKLYTTAIYWYEEKRGLLLRIESYRREKRVNVEELQNLTPGFESLEAIDG